MQYSGTKCATGHTEGASRKHHRKQQWPRTSGSKGIAAGYLAAGYPAQLPDSPPVGMCEACDGAYGFLGLPGHRQRVDVVVVSHRHTCRGRGWW